MTTLWGEEEKRTIPMSTQFDELLGVVAQLVALSQAALHHQETVRDILNELISRVQSLEAAMEIDTRREE